MIVEDTQSLALSYAGTLEKSGYVAEIADSIADASEKLAAGEHFPVLLLDLQLPDGDGLDLLRAFPKLAEEASIIVVTADGSINRAVEAMQRGAYDFIVKPLAPERLLTSIRNALERTELKTEIKTVKRRGDRRSFHGFIGKSPAMQAVYRAIENVANSNATVFITGESGTGKEVAAEAIHAESQRRRGAFVAINCGAIPENLLESELFGHVKGAFTGAVENRVGAAREADGGTLFLDEIGEMDLKLQVKLLRFLQTSLIQRVGTSRTEAVDVRVICATNRDPVAEVAAGRFREDLFYRLAVIPLELPALRDRGEDIGLLAQSFLAQMAEEEGKSFDPLAPDALQLLQSSAFPGNVRELQNVIRRAVIMNPGPTVAAREIASHLEQGQAVTTGVQSRTQVASDTGADVTDDLTLSLEGMTLDEVNRLAIESAIQRAGGSLPAAAKALGVSPSTLYRKREKWLSKTG
ncbi:sigma-54-dependent Fis family transcriptional regulator [Parasphingopyxis algicola]|nr:sigma-54-dependent Fis family transcriptional regulator [Parasphingopyxis algicola]